MVINNEKWAALGDDDKAAFARRAGQTCGEPRQRGGHHHAQSLNAGRGKCVPLRGLTPAVGAAWGEARDYRAERGRWAQEQQRLGAVGAAAVLGKLKARLLPAQ